MILRRPVLTSVSRSYGSVFLWPESTQPFSYSRICVWSQFTVALVGLFGVHHHLTWSAAGPCPQGLSRPQASRFVMFLIRGPCLLSSSPLACWSWRHPSTRIFCGGKIHPQSPTHCSTASPNVQTLDLAHLRRFAARHIDYIIEACRLEVSIAARSPPKRAPRSGSKYNSRLVVPVHRFYAVNNG